MPILSQSSFTATLAWLYGWFFTSQVQDAWSITCIRETPAKPTKRLKTLAPFWAELWTNYRFHQPNFQIFKSCWEGSPTWPTYYHHILSLHWSLKKIISKRNGVFEPFLFNNLVICCCFFTPRPPPTPTLSKANPTIFHETIASSSDFADLIQKNSLEVWSHHHRPYILPCLLWPWPKGTFRQYK